MPSNETSSVNLGNGTSTAPNVTTPKQEPTISYGIESNSPISTCDTEELIGYKELYCLNNGDCFRRKILTDKPVPFCVCKGSYFGKRCEYEGILDKYLNISAIRTMTRQETAVLILSLTIVGLVIGFICFFCFYRRRKNAHRSRVGLIYSPRSSQGTEIDSPVFAGSDVTRVLLLSTDSRGLVQGVGSPAEIVELQNCAHTDWTKKKLYPINHTHPLPNEPNSSPSEMTVVDLEDREPKEEEEERQEAIRCRLTGVSRDSGSKTPEMKQFCGRPTLSPEPPSSDTDDNSQLITDAPEKEEP